MQARMKLSLFRTLGARTCAKGYKEIPTSGYENLLSRPGAPANRSLVRGAEGQRSPRTGLQVAGGSSFRWMYAPWNESDWSFFPPLRYSDSAHGPKPEFRTIPRRRP